MNECTHTPNCNHCMVCGNPLPEWKPALEGESFTFLVKFEKDIQHTIIGCRSADEAIEMSVTSISRSSRLCPQHMVRALSVEKIEHMVMPKIFSREKSK